MNINDLTLGELKQIQNMVIGVGAEHMEAYVHPLEGRNVIIRTVTMIYTGLLHSITNDEYVLLNCSWIPDTGRWMQFVAKGTVTECEPYPADLLVYVGRGSVVDKCELRAALPREQK